MRCPRQSFGLARFGGFLGLFRFLLHRRQRPASGRRALARAFGRRTDHPDARRISAARRFIELFARGSRARLLDLGLRRSSVRMSGRFGCTCCWRRRRRFLRFGRRLWSDWLCCGSRCAFGLRRFGCRGGSCFLLRFGRRCRRVLCHRRGCRIIFDNSLRGRIGRNRDRDLFRR